MENNLKYFNRFSIFENKILKDHIKKIINAPSEDIKLYNMFKNNAHLFIDDINERKLILQGFDYIISPIIIDDFEKHETRRFWFKELYIKDKKLFDLISSNKLRVNRISAVTRIVAMPNFFFPKIKEPIDNFTKASNKNIEFLKYKYQKLDIKDKINFVNITTNLAKTFIKHILDNTDKYTI